jgi:hypothetical protein
MYSGKPRTGVSRNLGYCIVVSIIIILDSLQWPWIADGHNHAVQTLTGRDGHEPDTRELFIIIVGLVMDFENEGKGSKL